MWRVRINSNKFGAKKREIDGYTFDSRAEADRYLELKLLERAGQISELKVHQPHELLVEGQKICTYEVDFEYLERGETYFGGQKWKHLTKVVEDVKGKRTREYILKRNLFKALFPRIEFREVSACRR